MSSIAEPRTGFEQELLAGYAAARSRLWGATAKAVRMRSVRMTPLLMAQGRSEAAMRLGYRGLFPTATVFVSDGEARARSGKLGRTAAPGIMREVAEKYGFSLDDLVGKSRSFPLVTARQEAMYRLRNETIMSLPEVGRRFNRDHTTALHSVRKHEERVASDLQHASPFSPLFKEHTQPTALTLAKPQRTRAERLGTALEFSTE